MEAAGCSASRGRARGAALMDRVGLLLIGVLLGAVGLAVLGAPAIGPRCQPYGSARAPSRAGSAARASNVGACRRLCRVARRVLFDVQDRS